MDLRSYKKLVLFGGSFDPPHVAHVQLPILAAQAIGADGIIYIPSGHSPFKMHQSQTPAHHRLAMLAGAIENISHATIDTYEIDRAHAHDQQQPTYTIDTLEHLRRRLDAKTKLRLLIGADLIKTFDQWRHPQRIVELAEPLIMVRPPDNPQSVLASLPSFGDRDQWAARLVDVPQIDVSSSKIRQRAQQNKSLTDLVPPAVEAYIKDHGLYQKNF